MQINKQNKMQIGYQGYTFHEIEILRNTIWEARQLRCNAALTSQFKRAGNMPYL